MKQTKHLVSWGLRQSAGQIRSSTIVVVVSELNLTRGSWGFAPVGSDMTGLLA